MFQEQNPSTFQRACHKELCTEIQGGLMSCSDCGKKILHQTLSTVVLNGGETLSCQVTE